MKLQDKAIKRNHKEHSKPIFKPAKGKKKLNKFPRQRMIKQGSNSSENHPQIAEQIREFFSEENFLKINNIFHQLNLKQSFSQEIKSLKPIVNKYNEIFQSSDLNSTVLLLSQSSTHAIANSNENIRQIPQNEGKFYKLCKVSSEQEYQSSCKLIKDSLNYTQEKFSSSFQKKLFEKQKLFYALLARKTYLQGLNQDPIDYLNYFKYASHCEQDKPSEYYQPIASHQQLNLYLKKRRNRFRKAAIFLLYTACNSCLSSHFQDSNPIINCPECHLRIHKLCLNVNKVKRCGRCIYHRIPIRQRQQMAQCFICESNYLIPQRVGPKLFAHTFCLIGHRFEKIQQNTITLNPQSLSMHEKEIDQCYICGKQSKFLVNCLKCHKKQHLICCFLNGGRIMDEAESQEAPKVICCEMERQELATKRKYILNYKNEAYNWVKKAQKEINN